MARIQVLNENERHSGVNRQRVEEFLVRFQAAGRRADRHYRKSVVQLGAILQRRPFSQRCCGFRRNGLLLRPMPDVLCALRSNTSDFERPAAFGGIMESIV